MAEIEEELTCVVCLELLSLPCVELEPCRHVFCKECVRTLSTCPVCRATITARHDPNHLLRKLIDQARQRRSSISSNPSSSSPAGASGPPVVVAAAAATTTMGSQSPANTTFTNSHHHSSSSNSSSGNVSRVSSSSQLLQQPPVFRTLRADNHPQPWLLYNISSEEYDQIFALFLNFDADDSGQLDFNELYQLTTSLNYAKTRQEVEQIFRVIDKDRSGGITLDEFCSWLMFKRQDTRSLYGMSQSEYHTALMQFRSLDTNHDGELDLQEFVKLATSHFSYSAEFARGMFVEIDTDHSGKISLHEFLVYRRGANFATRV